MMRTSVRTGSYAPQRPQLQQVCIAPRDAPRRLAQSGKRRVEPIPCMTFERDASRTVMQGNAQHGPHTQRVQKIAFFDVDGTLVDSNIVIPYVLLRLEEMSLVERIVWLPFFGLLCIGFILLDLVDRSTFNVVFYALYAGRTAGQAKAQHAQHVFDNYMLKKTLPGAVKHVQKLKAEGWHVVLVTGALDFFMEPVADHFGADHVIAASLEEVQGVFTGKLQGVPVAAAEKVRHMQEYAARMGVPLKDCAAYSDSYSDLPMLSIVGKAYAVNADPRLVQTARSRQWEVLDWRTITS